MIDTTIVIQVNTFFLSVLFGWSIGAVYDLWREIWKHLWNTPFMMDTVFWILTGIGLFLFTICNNEGMIRGYLFLGWLLGWLSYRYIFRKMVRRFYIFGQDLLKKIKKAVKMSIGGR